MSETGEDTQRAETGARLAAAAIWTALALLLATSALLWLQFGPQVFLDAALAAWKSCF